MDQVIVSERGYGGFDCEFVKKPEEIENECYVCQLIYRDPHSTSCCGHSFCRDCIDRIKDSSNPWCPLCKQQFETHPNKWLQRNLYQRQVYCTYRKKGCDWVGNLGHLDEHLNPPHVDQQNLLDGCGLFPLRCYACSENVPRKGYGVHISDLCDQRAFSCEYCCEYNSTYIDVINHHWPRCPCYPVECVNKCGAHPKRKDAEGHISNQCPLTAIPCEFCSAQILRGEMREHLASNLTQHITLLVDPFREELKKLRDQVVQGEKRLHDIRQENWCLQDDVQSLTTRVAKNEETIHRLTITGLEAQRIHAEIFQQNDILRSDYEVLQKGFEDLKKENEKLYARVYQLNTDDEHSVIDSIDGSRSSSPYPLADSDRSSFESVPSAFGSMRKARSLQVPVMHTYSRDFDRTYQEAEQYSSPPTELLMQNYSAYRSSNGDLWESQPFYSGSRPSYKLCLSVRASKCLSLLICLMRGDDDDQLKWPFNAKITIQLINHVTHGKNYQRDVFFKDGWRVKKGNAAAGGRGLKSFITIFENSSFLKDDTLWFKVVNVELL